MRDDFKKVSKDTSMDKFLSITANLIGRFSAQFLKEHYSGEDYAILYISEEELELAVELNDGEGLKVTSSSDSKVISMTRVIKELNIDRDDISTSVRFPYVEEDDEVFIFDCEPLIEEVFHTCEECGNRYEKKGDLKHHKVTNHS